MSDEFTEAEMQHILDKATASIRMDVMLLAVLSGNDKAIAMGDRLAKSMAAKALAAGVAELQEIADDHTRL